MPGILHRDLEPSKVVLDVHRLAIVTDLGIATATREVAALGSGTPAYRAAGL